MWRFSDTQSCMAMACCSVYSSPYTCTELSSVCTSAASAFKTPQLTKYLIIEIISCFITFLHSKSLVGSPAVELNPYKIKT